MELSDCTVAYIDHKNTGYFSSLIIDYLNNEENLRQFIKYAPTEEGIKQAIEERKNFPINRAVLVATINQQYEAFHPCDEVKNNIQLLLSENTFTVCTAHQPNILTGYAYFIYKIMHTIVLAAHLKKKHSEYNFVPVFYIGSEDDDLDELGTVRYNGKKFIWNTNQTGAVGNMQTEDLQPLIIEFLKLLGPPSDKTDYISKVIKTAYNKYPTISAATTYIINELMGTFGIVVIDPNNAELKATFKDIIHKEIIQPEAYKLVQATNNLLNKNYKSQAFVRPINFFYLSNGQRNRIEQINDDEWQVVNTSIRWDKATLEKLIDEHAEYFSPNVILRPLYQETILPNVAFIGGGSEVAYWMQLKSVFENYNVFFPSLILRQSIQFQNKASKSLQEKLGYDLIDLFKPKENLINAHIEKTHAVDLQATQHFQKVIQLLNKVKDDIIFSLDKNLENSIAAASTKMQHQINIIDTKIKRAAKKQENIAIDRIEKLKAITFPNNSLMERYETFIPDYLEYNLQYFDLLAQTILPFGNRFLFITPKF